MPGNRYLLLGWYDEVKKTPTRVAFTKSTARVVALVKGDAKTIIKAAVAANCPVLLIDSVDVPSAVTSAMMDSNAPLAPPSPVKTRPVAPKRAKA